ncbi:RagB/SusD family nutrient uptake outer membrane protein [Sabulilitoribacter multivorans]|uniref:RagB/SusD family nutrient uptake outer membrane protein n=1 Tax=Flaviramulus multivorans TaxID=1304750 RepID=A0ABS9ILH6_9FLAO|nr:RagB/SusD family nutrient uptake outer membrane protein [Flaviramulus multivorans]MCF7561467.1 RagB/SusD family nutrient uptake outer membrane protein [Flaviramulus multivorans]
MLNNLKKVLFLFFGVTIMVSCTGEIDDLKPINQETSASVFDNPEAYKSFLAKIYAGIAISGQQGPAGNPDLAGLDEGFSNYLRLYWKLQELTTDEALIGWNDGTIKDLHYQNWTPGNEFIRTMYDRILYQIALANEFLRQTSDGVLDSRGVDANLKAEIQTYRAEARFMRALSYYHALDFYRNVPFTTEEDPIGAFLPNQTNGQDLFSYIESELIDIDADLMAPGQNEYARADKAAAWMLLSKLYLNAEVYTGTARYSDARIQAEKVISSGVYSLEPNYEYLFLADNHLSNEIIFPIAFDGLNTQAYGGMTFLVHAPVGGSMSPADFGVSGGWAGVRTTSAFVEKFPGMENSADGRELFYTAGQTLEIENVSRFTDGFAIAKYKNLDRSGTPGSDPSGEFPDTDFPMFRLAEAYLIYAEANVKGGGGDAGTAVGYINLLRARAYGDSSGNIQASDLTEDFILDERARELYWECHRRTDLVRFGKFTSSSVWPWKGNVPGGTTTESFRDLFPLPTSDLSANPNLIQNPGY